ncbi:conserved hypothetical protein [Chlamydia pneumoniae LPCoLN]|uniref:hypothetical protein n=1 Tax=Chlamydia pneumoniae TaxID=83558 RepID=UPI0001BD9C90|nr:hypothetical protein [Chlamydia pneumoniae]ACZ33263.1 conserved hypothetical protein [Chlamydia pneumoniae LPCoLN]ETR80163.1 hypothetical protein X556_0505 [Chlamydia pneumoniae B21]
MSCFNLTSTNESLRPISPKASFPKQGWQSYFRSALRKHRSNTLSVSVCKVNKYDVNLFVRLTVIALAVVGVLILFSIMLASIQGTLVITSWPLVTAAILIPTILLTGGMYILHRLGKKVDVISGVCIPPFSRRCWVPISCSHTLEKFDEKHVSACSYLDISTLSADGSGIAAVYQCPPLLFRAFPCFGIPCAMPFVALLRMIYNLIRFLVVPFYIIFRMIYEHFFCKHLPEDDRFICKDIAREMGRSLAAFLKAPFYASACMIGAFYSLLDPLAGRVLMGSVERDWNDNVILARSVSLANEAHSLFRFEGGGGRKGLGQHAFYLMLCCQPQSVFLFDKGEIVSGAHPSIQLPERRGLDTSGRYPHISVIPDSGNDSAKNFIV